MTTLAPFTRHLFDNLNSLLEENLAPAVPTTPEANQIFSADTGWVLRVDLPGFEKSDLELQFADQALHLKAERPTDAEFQRPAEGHRFPLGDEVDSSAISAKLAHGVLEITLPKKEEIPAESLTIEIQ